MMNADPFSISGSARLAKGTVPRHGRCSQGIESPMRSSRIGCQKKGISSYEALTLDSRRAVSQRQRRVHSNPADGEFYVEGGPLIGE
jgi:hypothetical protein